MAERSIRSTRVEWSQVRVGALITVALVLLAYGVYRVGDLFDVFADRYPLITLLTRADGLLEGAPVTLAGQRVGQVDAIDFLPVGFRTANLSVRLSINQEVQEHIRSDSYARVRTQGLLGDKFVDIEPGSATARVLQPWDTIPGIAPVDLEDLLVSADTTLKEARAVIGNLRTITASLLAGEGTLGQLLVNDDLYFRMVAATTELQVLLAEIYREDGTVARLIQDPTLYNRLVGAATRVDALASAILYGEGTLTRILTSDELYESLLGVVGRADTTIASLNAAFGSMTAGGGTVQRLLTDPRLYDELLKAVIDLQILINDIRKNPRRFRPEVNVDIF